MFIFGKNKNKKMTYTKEAVNLDLSIAGNVNLNNIFKSEKVDVIFTNEDGDAWDGDYTFFIFNSKKKNTVNEWTDAVVVVSNEMTLTIDPTSRSLEAGSYYYEIINKTSQRVEFHGDLKIKL